MIRRVVSACLMTAGLAVLTSGSAMAAKEIKMTAISGLSAASVGTKLIKTIFIKRVDEELAKSGEYKIKWIQSYGGAVAKQPDGFEAIQDGIGDIGYVNILFEGAKMPMEQYTYVTPYGDTDLMKLRNLSLELRKRIPEMSQEYRKYNQIDLAHIGIPNYYFLSTYPIKSVGDLKGHKFGAPGLAANWLTGTGGIAVSGKLSSYYNSLKTGVYDGIIIFDSGIAPFKFHEVAKNITEVNMGSMIASTLSINKTRWDGFPKVLRDIMTKVAVEYEIGTVNGNTEKGVWSLDKAVKSGAKLHKVSAAQRKAFADAMPNIAKKWAKSIDAKGLPGTKVLNTYMELSRKAGITHARAWDK